MQIQSFFITSERDKNKQTKNKKRKTRNKPKKKKKKKKKKKTQSLWKAEKHFSVPECYFKFRPENFFFLTQQ